MLDGPEQRTHRMTITTSPLLRRIPPLAGGLPPQVTSALQTEGIATMEIILALVVGYIIYRTLKHFGEQKNTTESTVHAPHAISTAVDTFKEGVSTIPSTVSAATAAARASYEEAQRQKDLADLLARLQKNPDLISQMAAAATQQKLATLPPPPPPSA